jgi:hypothetical protein
MFVKKIVCVSLDTLHSCETFQAKKSVPITSNHNLQVKEVTVYHEYCVLVCTSSLCSSIRTAVLICLYALLVGLFTLFLLMTEI